LAIHHRQSTSETQTTLSQNLVWTEHYVNATLEVFHGQVRVCIDRFHVMKNFQDQLTQARREIQKTLSKEAAKELKGTRWLWQTNLENLTPCQRIQLEALKRKYPKLREVRFPKKSGQ
jgi:transposase